MPPYLKYTFQNGENQICTNYNNFQCVNDFDVNEIKVMHSEKWLAYQGKWAFACVYRVQSCLYRGVLVVISLFKHL